jgi:hypothetical protein
MRIAYAVPAEIRDTYLGAVLAVGNGSLDVNAELEKGDGFVLVSEHDHLTLAVLDDYTALERVGERPDAAPGETPDAATPEPEPEAPTPVLATDGEPIEIPDGVVPGETPGWPVDAATSAPLRLDDEQRKKLAETPLDKQPETVRELLQGAGITPPADTGRAGRQSSTTTIKER